MKEYLKHQKVVGRKPKSNLVRTLVAVAGIGLAGIGAYKICDYVKNSKEYETISDIRAKYLKLANEQMLQTQNPETINGLNLVIKDIENGVYDYSK